MVSYVLWVHQYFKNRISKENQRILAKKCNENQGTWEDLKGHQLKPWEQTWWNVIKRDDTFESS